MNQCPSSDDQEERRGTASAVAWGQRDFRRDRDGRGQSTGTLLHPRLPFPNGTPVLPEPPRSPPSPRPGLSALPQAGPQRPARSPPRGARTPGSATRAPPRVLPREAAAAAAGGREVRTVRTRSRRHPATGAMPGPRRDRPAVLLLLGALLAADLYFHLWPRARRELAPSAPSCPCRLRSAPSAAPPPPPPPPPARAASSSSSSSASSSPLRRLFAHPLYRAAAPPGPAEPLLGAREALRYYRRKAARWNRCVPPRGTPTRHRSLGSHPRAPQTQRPTPGRFIPLHVSPGTHPPAPRPRAPLSRYPSLVPHLQALIPKFQSLTTPYPAIPNPAPHPWAPRS